MDARREALWVDPPVPRSQVPTNVLATMSGMLSALAQPQLPTERNKRHADYTQAAIKGI